MTICSSTTIYSKVYSRVVTIAKADVEPAQVVFKSWGKCGLTHVHHPIRCSCVRDNQLETPISTDAQTPNPTHAQAEGTHQNLLLLTDPRKNRN